MARSHTSRAHRTARTGDRRRSAWVGAIIGVAVMAAVDEIIFHQVLAWHHFYDRSTPDIALLSDGLLHAVELVLLVAGIFLIADLARSGTLRKASVTGGVLIGAGFFQLFDGLVNHKVLRLHQVRYDVDLLPYDLSWNIAGAVVLAAGIVVLAVVGRQSEDSVPARA